MSQYEIINSEWDGESTLRLVDHHAQAEAEVIPAVGLHLFRFDVRNHAYIAKPASLAELRVKSSRYGVPILFPPGRVKLAAFSFEGREYRLPVNREPDHAHGELRERPWKVIASGADAAGGAFVSAEFDFAEHPDMLAYYPHAACFRFTYRLKDGTLSLSGEIANRSGQTMPLSLGFHPYFAFAKGEANRVRVVIPAAAEWPLSADGYAAAEPASSPLTAALKEGTLVTELPNYPGGSQMLSIEPGPQTCELQYEARGTKLVYDMGDKFPIHVLFTAPWTEAVSLEPYTSIMNVFNEPFSSEISGALGLVAGETFKFKWSIHIEPLQ
ncbi:aldose 1-epimerase [Paenibacillus frigoriresistens]|uniref:aldose 1-epimerase n=1 Tax=Paenibacillus alginolyticus TaxID=59839 RepID=UPI0015636B98|nr:aldose 1-epimerase [Paenibacillus frigoriresistens]NRF89542.1 aldose 1-epimerase [Paenibacillus frigoriresistens]